MAAAIATLPSNPGQMGIRRAYRHGIGRRADSDVRRVASAAGVGGDVEAVSGSVHAEAIGAHRRWEGWRLITRRRLTDRKDFNNALAVAGFAGGVVALAALITVMLTLG